MTLTVFTVLRLRVIAAFDLSVRKGGKRVASSDLRVHVPRMGTSSQSSL